MLGAAAAAAGAAAGDPLGCGMTGAPKAPWLAGRPASLTSPDAEEVRLSREACWPTEVRVRNETWERAASLKKNQLRNQAAFPTRNPAAE